MADPTPKTLKGLAVYLGLGAATLAYSASRAAKGLPVWPGFKNSAGEPPGAAVGAAETVLLWPAPALWYLTSPEAQPKSTSTPPLMTSPGNAGLPNDANPNGAPVREPVVITEPDNANVTYE